MRIITSINQQTRAYFYAITTVVLWSTIASALKISLGYLDSFQLLFIASLTASLSLFLILVFQGKLPLLFQLTHADNLCLLIFGLLNPLLYYLMLFKAYDLLPAQVAQSLNYTWAITLMLLSIPILKHKVNRYDMVATLICYSGVVIICMSSAQLHQHPFNIAGIALALGSTVIWAVYWLYKTRDKTDLVVGLFLGFLYSLPFVSIACYLFSDLFSWHPYGVLGGVYIGLFEMGITFVFWLTALKLTSSTAKISTLIFCSPFLSLFFIHFFVGERIATTTIAGLIMIVVGLILQRKGEARI